MPLVTAPLVIMEANHHAFSCHALSGHALNYGGGPTNHQWNAGGKMFNYQFGSAGFQTCLGCDPQHLSVLKAKHVSNSDVGTCRFTICDLLAAGRGGKIFNYQ